MGLANPVDLFQWLFYVLVNLLVGSYANVDSLHRRDLASRH
jgi:hypothetical protein